MFNSRKAYLAYQCKKMLYHPYSYRSTIDKNPIPLQRICVLSYLCLLLTKVLFETSFKSFQYRRQTSIKLFNQLILCSHYRSRCKGLCQNKKHGFDQYTKGGHFCAAHLALRRLPRFPQYCLTKRVFFTFLCTRVSLSFKKPYAFSSV